MDEKRCSKCEQMLPLARFYRNASKKDGFNSWCKDCQKRYMVEYRGQNRERRAEYIAQWKKTPKGKASQRRDKQSLRQRRPEVIQARNTLNHAIQSGKLTRQPCQFCGDSQSEAHHPDYSRPLVVVWACFKCHREKLHGQTVISQEQES